MSVIELKPCPFCGSKPRVQVEPASWGYHDGSVQIECKCGASAGYMQDADKKRAAAEQWNTRASLTPPEGYVLVPVDVQKDAERYRFLRQYSVDSYLAGGTGDKLDQSIDAAMLAARPEVE